MTAMIADNLPVLVIIVPLFIGVVLPVFARRLRLVEGMVVLAEALGALWAPVFLLTWSLPGKVLTGSTRGGWLAPWGIELTANSLAVFFPRRNGRQPSDSVVHHWQPKAGSRRQYADSAVLYTFLLLVGSLCGYGTDK